MSNKNQSCVPRILILCKNSHVILGKIQPSLAAGDAVVFSKINKKERNEVRIGVKFNAHCHSTPLPFDTQPAQPISVNFSSNSGKIECCELKCGEKFAGESGGVGIERVELVDGVQGEVATFHITSPHFLFEIVPVPATQKPPINLVYQFGDGGEDADEA